MSTNSVTTTTPSTGAQSSNSQSGQVQLTQANVDQLVKGLFSSSDKLGFLENFLKSAGPGFAFVIGEMEKDLEKGIIDGSGLDILEDKLIENPVNARVLSFILNSPQFAASSGASATAANATGTTSATGGDTSGSGAQATAGQAQTVVS